MGLGGVGISLTDLTMLYGGLARGGNTIALTERRDDIAAPAQRRLLDPVAAWYVGNVMIGTPPPENAVGGRIAFKTGTSYGYRDAWSVGFDGKRTVGVWVGRPDGAPVPGLVGRSAAAPILFDAFARMGGLPAALPKAPKGAIFAANNRLPPPLQRFRTAAIPTDTANPAPRIMFPPNGARLAIGGQRDGAENLRRRRAADAAGERRAACHPGRATHAVLHPRRAGFRAADRDGCARRRGQRRGPDRVGKYPVDQSIAVSFESIECLL